ncbi:MAG: MFS transporter [Pseudohongiella sp.]|nr:MFS transporter [Pseudohongiella sp.]
MSTAEKQAGSKPERPSIVLLIALGMLSTLVAVVFARLAYGLVLPSMRENLGLSYAQAANLGTVTAIGYLSVLLYAGVFAGRHGSKKAILLGMLFACAGFSGLSISTNYGLLMMCMVLLGFGTAFTFTPLISLLGSWYPDRRGTVIGFANSGVGIGMLISGALVPALTQANPSEGWRQVWMIFALSAAITGLLIAAFLRSPPVSQSGSSLKQGLLSVYRSPHVVIMGLIYGIVGLTYIVQTLFMYSFTLASDVPAITAGRLVALMGIISVFAGPAWGVAADRIGHANALVICMLLAMLGNLLPVIWPTTPVFALHYILIGLSISGLFTSILAASTSTVQPHLAAMAVSFVTVFFALGQLIGPAVAGVLIEWQQDFRLSFGLCAALLLLGTALSHRSRRFLMQRN